MKKNLGKAERLTFRDELKHFIQSKYQGAELTQAQYSRAMLEVYLKEIWSPLRKELEDEDIEAGLCDRSGDVQADFIHRDDGHVLIIQCKYHGKKKGKDAWTEFESFLDILPRLHPVIGKGYSRNSQVEELGGDIDFRSDSFHLVFVSLGASTPNIRAGEKRGVKPHAKLKGIEDRAEVSFVDEETLNIDLRAAHSKGMELPEDVVLHFARISKNQAPFIKYTDSHNHTTYVGIIKTAEIGSISQRLRERLFALNIRNWLGNTVQNKSIASTLTNAPEHFFSFNNGISSVARSVRDNGDGSLTADNFQVINGAQTVRAIKRALDKRESLDSAHVLIRITEVPNWNKPSEQEYFESITRYNNTQNVIKLSDFRSNDVVQQDLEKRFAGLHYSGKTVWYRPKRTGKVRPNTISIRLEEFTKTVYSFLRNPIDFATSSSFLFDTSPHAGYFALFEDGKDPLSHDQFELYAGVWFCCDYLNALLKRRKKGGVDDLQKAALERRWFVYLSFRLLLEKSYGGEAYQQDLRKLHKPVWRQKEDSKTCQVLRTYFESAVNTLLYVYREARNGPGFVHRNWYRSASSTKKLGEFVSTAPIQIPGRLI